MTPSLKCRNKSCPICSAYGREVVTGVVARDSLGGWWIVGELHKHRPQGTVTYPDRANIVPGRALELLHCDGWREGLVDGEGNLCFSGVDYDKLGSGTECIPLEALMRTGRTVRVVW